jgi:hypothetical protein
MQAFLLVALRLPEALGAPAMQGVYAFSANQRRTVAAWGDSIAS